MPQGCDTYHYEQRDKRAEEKTTSSRKSGFLSFQSRTNSLLLRYLAAWQLGVATCVTPRSNVTNLERFHKFYKLVQFARVLALGNAVFFQWPLRRKNSILKPYYYHFSRSQSFAKTHGKKPSTWLSAIFNVCETTFWRKRTDAIWSCLSLTISELCSFSPTGWQARDYFDVRKIPSAAKIFNSVAHFVLRVKTEKTSSRDRSI